MLLPFICILFLAVSAWAYFKIANKFNIIDKPNERSSHTAITIRGGGILFPLAWIFYTVTHSFVFPFFTLGLVAISVISFLDDIYTISSRYRILIHILAFTCCFYELHLFTLPLWVIISTYIVAIGCLNAINFMDGINGMTGMYMLSFFLPLLFLFEKNDNPILYIILSLLVFGFLNFRKKAKCFAGDIGSVSIAFIVTFILCGLMFEKLNSNFKITSNENYTFQLKYLLLLTLYGVDAILTLVQRLYLKENIFKPHRKHLYQLFSNELKINHVVVSFIYMLLQLGISMYVVQNTISTAMVWIIILVFVVVYIFLKKYLLQKIKTN